MSFKDLRSFLRKLDEEGQLVKYDQPIKLSPEWYDMVRALPRLGQYGPALITDQLEGYRVSALWPAFRPPPPTAL